MTAPAEPSIALPRLLDRVRWHLRVKRYSIRTEQAYLDWIRRFILFHGKRHPSEVGEQQIAAFLSHLAIDRRVAASTQNQAFSALLFLYQQVLEKKLHFITGVERVRRPPKLPVVFTRAEARAVIAQLELHLARVRQLHRHDLSRGGGAVYLPFAIARKYGNASRDWRWQYVFPAAKLSSDPRGGGMRRHHVGEKNLQNAVNRNSSR